MLKTTFFAAAVLVGVSVLALSFLGHESIVVAFTSSGSFGFAATRRKQERARRASSVSFLSAGPTPRNHQRDEDNHLTAPRSSKAHGNAPLSSSSATSQRHERRRRQAGRRAWLSQATTRMLQSPDGSFMEMGKWHEVVSMIAAWSSFAKTDGQSPVRMEQLLTRLWDEHASLLANNDDDENTAGSADAPAGMVDWVDLYNRLLDAWACAAHFGTQKPTQTPQQASQRAREILVTWQEQYEAAISSAAPASSGDGARHHNAFIEPPNARSFALVLHVVCRVEGALIARRVLAWMEHLYKSGKNPEAQPTLFQYTSVLATLANQRNRRHQQGTTNTGKLAEGFLRHMIVTGISMPDVFCYNLAIKAWNHQKGRDAAEHADRLLEEMVVPPDVVTYASVITAWAGSGMRAHAVARAEELLEEMQQGPAEKMGSEGDQRERHDPIQPNTVVYNTVMSAWVKSRNPGSVQRTGEILRLMESSSSTDQRPDLFSYNTHLHALSQHASHQKHRGRGGYADRAGTLLQRMEEAYDHGRVSFEPNLFSYNLVLEAYSRCCNNIYGDPAASQAACQVLRRLIRRPSVEPDIFSFNQVLSCLSKNSHVTPGSARRAEDLLLYMEDAHQSSIHPRAQPNVHSFSHVIVAYARSNDASAAERSQALLERMKQSSYVQPNLVCYNALMDCWAKSGQGTYAARKAEALLQELQALFQEGDITMEPNIISYNAVLNAWAQSGTRCCAYKAEQYLNELNELANGVSGSDGGSDIGDNMSKRKKSTNIKPNDLSYNTVIHAISKSHHARKAQRALSILRRMDKLYRSGDNRGARPNEVTYTAVLNSCAIPAADFDRKTRRNALDTAVFTLKELQQSRYGQPNQITYGTFIKACANLLDAEDDDDLRRVIVAQVFQDCCKDGQVGDMVLTYLRKAAPTDLYEELLADFVVSSDRGAVLRVEDLPAEWSCNLRDEDKKWTRLRYKQTHYQQRTDTAKRRNNRKSTRPSQTAKP